MNYADLTGVWKATLEAMVITGPVERGVLPELDQLESMFDNYQSQATSFACLIMTNLEMS